GKKHDSQTSSRISCVVCFEAEHIPYVRLPWGRHWDLFAFRPFDLLSGEDAAHFFPDSARGIPDIHDSTTVRYGPEQGASCIA
ncbi:hypothetical protein ADUPG1_003800, partial [Aduncisulcus paluster]